MLELAGLGAPPGHHLVGADGHGAEVLRLPGVLADVLRRELRLVEELLPPLADRHRVGGQDQGPRAHEAHDRHARHGLAGPAREHDHPAAAERRPAGVERLGRAALVGAEGEGAARRRRLPQPDLERIPVHVAPAVVDGEADADQPLLQLAAVDAVHEDPPVRRGAERGHGLMLEHLREHRRVVGGEFELALPRIGALDAEQAVALDPAADLRHDGPGHRHARVGVQGTLDPLRRDADRRRVPHGDRGHPVRVQVVRALLQLREERELITGLREQRVLLGLGVAVRVADRTARPVHTGPNRVEHHAPIALDDQRVGRQRDGQRCALG